jgi:hypothetical protein
MGNGSSTTATTQTKVPNPRYQDLERLKARIERAAPALRGALDRPAQDMGSRKVWIGTTAEAFEREVSGRKQRLASAVQALLDGVEAELRATPRECTPEQASGYRRERRMAL